VKVKTDILYTLAKVAEANDSETNVKFAAAIVKGNKIISIGFNSMKSHPLQARFGKNEEAIYFHAEIHAIKNALREITIDEFEKTDLYIARVKKPTSYTDKYVWGLAKPCEGCKRAINEFGIRNVVYTTDEHGQYEVM
jgi:deoxycytidylate deaminase